MKYFLDTEFIEGFKKPLFGKRRHFIDLISIGIVAEDGREYYAISNEYNWNDADDWVKENVIIQMYCQEIHGDKRNHMSPETFHKYIPNGKSKKQIGEEIINFINSEPIKTIGTTTIELSKESADTLRKGYLEPEFYGYYADYDWVLFCSLFGRMINLPKGFPMYCNDLKQSWDEFEKSNQIVTLSGVKYHSTNVKHLSNDYPKQENEHNALADAKWNKRLYDFLKTL